MSALYRTQIRKEKPTRVAGLVGKTEAFARAKVQSGRNKRADRSNRTQKNSDHRGSFGINAETYGRLGELKINS
jgi:hypothetical protein